MIEPVPAGVVSLSKSSWYRSRPKDQPLFLEFIKIQFRCPRISGGRFVLHHGNDFLFAPMNQIFRTRVADIPHVPSSRPYHMKDAIRSLHDARIPHQFFSANCWLQEQIVIVERGPMITVLTDGQMQSIAVSFERSKQKITRIVGFHSRR